MIHCITRHAAQHIWQQAMASATPQQGLLISTGDCITNALYPLNAHVQQHPCENETLARVLRQIPCALFHVNPPDAGRLTRAMPESGQSICGLFYHELPEAADVLEHESMLDNLDGLRLAPSLVHLYLDFHAAGLLKMAAYTLVNDRLIPVSLEMVD